MQYHFPSQRKLQLNGNLASWMMLHAPPTTASLFCFYYSVLKFYVVVSDQTINRLE